MKVSEHLAKATRPLFSFEVVPPARGHTIQVIVDVVNELLPYNPSWVDVTAHASHALYRERRDGAIDRIISKKRPGTIGICGVIQNRYRIDTVAHLLCLGFSREETEDALIELSYLGVHNVLALRGDGSNFEKKLDGQKTKNSYASELVEQIVRLRNGSFLHPLEDAEPVDMCIGVAGYPEKHLEAPNLATDIAFLKKKVDAGAEYVVTQMFFDNDRYFEFVRLCREAGITVPIVPGLKVLTTPSQLSRLPKTFSIDLPHDLAAEVMANPKHVTEIGVRHAVKQATDLLERGAPCLHYYVLNDARAVIDVLKKVKL